MEYTYKNIQDLIKINDTEDIWEISVDKNISFFLDEFNLPLNVKFLNYYTDEILWETNLGPDMWAKYNIIIGTKIQITTKNGKTIKEVCYNKLKYNNIIDDVFTTTISSKNLKNGVVIGAGSGSYGEWIYLIKNKKTSAILIEPDEKEFKKLIQYYSQYENVELLNICVDIEDGEKEFWLTPEGNVNSLKKENCLKYGIKENDLINKKIKVYSLNDLLKTKNIDWIRLDVEGMDSELILSLDDEILNKLKYIQYEHINITEYEKINTNLYLESKGFNVFMVGIDMVGIK
jgi:FkbM family methyltransferase